MNINQQPSKKFKFQFEEVDKIKIGIIVSEWNKKITSSLLDACVNTLITYKINEDNILIKWVPGSYELALGAQWLAEYSNANAVICLGCVIKGETPHFHYISEAVALGISNLSLKYNRPFIFGVLTTEKEQHAVDRAGGNKGNKGEEAAIAALKMIMLKDSFKETKSGSLGFC